MEKILRKILRAPLESPAPDPVFDPDLDLQFARDLALDHRITFTRASQATVVDSDGTLKWAGHNLLTFSEFDSADPTDWSANFDTGTGSRTLGSSLHNLPTLTFEQTVAGRRHITQTVTLEANTAYKLVLFIDEAESVFTSGNQTVFAITGLSDATGTKNVRIQDSVSGVLTCSFTTGSDTSGFVQIGIGCFADTVGKLVCAGVHLYKADRSMQQRTDVATGLETYYPTTSSAVYAARFDHDPATGESLGLLIEGQRTNNIRASEDFTAATWGVVASQMTVSANQTTAPDGTTTADKLVEGTGTVNPRIFDSLSNAPFSTDEVCVFSCFLKNNDARYAGLAVRSNSSSNFNAEFDLQEGVIVSSGKHGNSTFTSAEMKSYGNGWYRCVIIGKTDTSDVSSDMVIVSITDGSGVTSAGYSASFTGDGSSIFVWGAQFTTNKGLESSYVPTSGAAVTRSADSCEIPVNTFRYSQTEGTILLEGRKNHDDVSSAYMFYRLSDGTNGNSFTFQNKTNDDTQIRFIVKESAGNEVQSNLGVPVNQHLTSVFAYKKDDFVFAANGVSGTDTSGDVPQGITEFAIGKNQAESFHLHGHIKQIQYFARRLNDETVVALSQPSLEPSLSLVFDSSETSFVDTELTR